MSIFKCFRPAATAYRPLKDYNATLDKCGTPLIRGDENHDPNKGGGETAPQGISHKAAKSQDTAFHPLQESSSDEERGYQPPRLDTAPPIQKTKINADFSKLSIVETGATTVRSVESQELQKLIQSLPSYAPLTMTGYEVTVEGQKVNAFELSLQL